ncbi:MAG TPA: xanthine dehydrogenase family protein molybdopterin-binding subunit [Methylomirabilota bacterium]|nr:xanthine dehydrogenase family protein molybdopterin-binding subunit [Methylomirabilota bacterium]
MTDHARIGDPRKRKEDPRFLTGASRFTDDIALAGQLHGVVVRSPHAHARIRVVDVAAARSAPGVRLVLTAADVQGEIVRPIPSFSRTPPFDIRGPDGSTAPDAEQFPLARATARYAGQPVAFVVAESVSQAQDAAEQVQIDYEPLAAAVGIEEALAPDAPRVWDDRPSNVSFQWEGGDRRAVEAAFARAAHVTRVELVNNRIAPVFMEPRSAVAEYDSASSRWTLQVGCQSAHGMHAVLAHVVGIEPGRLRVVVPDTGGGFGARGGVYPEYPLLLVAARRLGQPVKWTSSRVEAFVADHQSRDHVLRGELALDAEGRFTAIRAQVDWRHGAYFTTRNVWVMVHYLPPTLGGPYRIPCGHVAIRGVFSHTTPLAAFRGIGRIEANYLTESLIEAAARETGMDRIELRRRNLVGQAALPWTTPGGAVVTSGAFAEHFDRALELADWRGFPARRAESAGRGMLRGFGVAMYVENDGSTPTEFAEIQATGDGRVVVAVGTQDFGMGHDTVFSQIAAEALGVPFDRIDVVFGDTERVARGAGSAGSRSARLGGGAVVVGARKLIEEGRALAAEMLEAAAADVMYATGRFTVAGTDRGVGLFEVAGVAEATRGRLAAAVDFTTAGDVHANGCHACEVLVNPDDGTLRIERHVIVADVGRAINPLIVHGQMHGGAAQGIGQALMEHVRFEAGTGQPLTGSFMEYVLPRADDLPPLTVSLNELPESDNPLGVKGAGENATTGAPAAVMNAVRDALQSAGAADVDMPATPERVWRALLGQTRQRKD